ncbi:MAG: patatin-like phospholipase family protein, partial [Pseudomonadales bacterium]
MIIVLRALLALCVLVTSANAAVLERPKIGLVLSGGGTKGGAHIGVLKVLEEQGVKPDYIVGTSVGAIIGAMYASGLSAAEIRDAIGAIDWRDVLIDDPPRATVPIEMKRGDFDYLVRSKPGFSMGQLKFPLGLSQGQKATRILKTLLSAGAGVENFDKLAIPFRAVATSLETGEAVVLSRGDLARSVRASMSLPAVFAPVLIDGQYLVDGGVAANLPIDVVRDMGAQIVIAVDISSPLRNRDDINSVIDVSDQLVNIMTRRNVDEQVRTLGPRDILIKPGVSEIAILDFERTLEAYEPGYNAASAQSERLAELARITQLPARP